ncbi:MAG: NADH-quinone oxidoreductase subunit NuoE [candidate division KSB1 bacterium]|nr:NADH-quinone oxidoreductase subunit NuoE [candidate division KSB1 bacterium]
METESILTKYPAGDPSALIAILQDIQQVHGYLPEKELQKVAKHSGLPMARIYGVATFYNQFRLQPLGKYVIRVCRGTACHVKGSFNILQTLENELGIKAGQTTRDLMFTIETVACIGACSIAPVIMVNDECYGKLDSKKVKKLLNDFRKAEEE